jgi:hypothetical protein
MAFIVGLGGREAMSVQRIGGVAAIALGVAIMAEIGAFLVYAPSLGVSVGDLGDTSKFLDVLIRGRTFFSYEAFAFACASIFAIALVRALDHRLRSGAADLSATAAILGYVAFVLLAADFQVRAAFAHMSTAELSRDAAMQAGPAVLVVARALGEAFSIAGGAYFALVSIAVLRVGALPRALGWLGLIIAAAVIVSIFAGIDPVPQVLIMVWSFWTGAVLLTQSEERWATSATRPVAAG